MATQTANFQTPGKSGFLKINADQSGLFTPDPAIPHTDTKHTEESTNPGSAEENMEIDKVVPMGGEREFRHIEAGEDGGPAQAAKARLAERLMETLVRPLGSWGGSESNRTDNNFERFLAIPCNRDFSRALVESRKKAGSGNRTRMACLEGRNFTTKLYPRITGFTLSHWGVGSTFN